MELTFYKSANPFFNAGLIGFLRESERFLGRYGSDYTDIEIVSDLSKNKISIKYSQEKKLMKFLEELYYFMGTMYYDTYTRKQEQNKENIYFEKEGTILKPHRFPKMNTMGLTALFTNNAQGVTREKTNSQKIKVIEQNDPELAEFIKKTFKEANIKLLEKVYFNEPYTKITRLDFKINYILSGENGCPVTGEKFKVLVSAQNISPFVSGIPNFNTHLSLSSNRLSWKALYIIRFSPVVCFYSYQNSYETLVCHLFESNSLENLNLFYRQSLYLKRDELETNGYLHNLQLGKFSYQNKEETISISYAKDASWASEISALLIYEFYRQQLQDKISIGKVDFDVLDLLPIIRKPITLITFRSDKFAKTMRPSFYEEYNQVKFLIQLIYGLEHGEWGGQILWQDIWQGLKWDSPKAQAMKKKNKFSSAALIERKVRAEIMEKVLNCQTILPTFEQLYYEIFSVLISGERTGYRKYQILLNFLKIYENLTNMELEKDLQDRAINLGTSIGQGIIRSGENDARVAAKQGRKYIIDLRNARTQEQFLKAIERIMFRYQINVSKDLLSSVTQKNYTLIKQFAVISALNQLNSILSSKSN